MPPPPPVTRATRPSRRNGSEWGSAGHRGGILGTAERLRQAAIWRICQRSSVAPPLASGLYARLALRHQRTLPNVQRANPGAAAVSEQDRPREPAVGRKALAQRALAARRARAAGGDRLGQRARPARLSSRPRSPARSESAAARCARPCTSSTPRASSRSRRPAAARSSGSTTSACSTCSRCAGSSSPRRCAGASSAGTAWMTCSPRTPRSRPPRTPRARCSPSSTWSSTARSWRSRAAAR